MFTYEQKQKLRQQYVFHATGISKDKKSYATYLDIPIKERAKIEILDDAFVLRTTLWDMKIVIFSPFSVFCIEGIVWKETKTNNNYTVFTKKEDEDEFLLFQSFDKFLFGDVFDEITSKRMSEALSVFGLSFEEIYNAATHIG